MKGIIAMISAVLVGAAAIAVCLLAPGYYAYLLGTLATTALVGVGLNVLLGLAGEVSLGQGGFLALGAYGVGILTTKAGLNFWEALPLAVEIRAQHRVHREEHAALCPNWLVRRGPGLVD